MKEEKPVEFRKRAKGIMVITMLMLGFMFAACDKDDKDKDKDEDPPIEDGYLVEAKVSTDGLAVTSVKAVLESGKVLAKGNYSGKGFTISLPVPNSKDLEEMTDDVQYCMPEFYAYDKKGNSVGGFLYYKAGTNDVLTFGVYMYFDNDLELHGDGGAFEASISVSKGWNMVYMITDDPNLERGKLTSKKQSGLSWSFIEWDEDDLLRTQMRAAVVRNLSIQNAFSVKSLHKEIITNCK